MKNRVNFKILAGLIFGISTVAVASNAQNPVSLSMKVSPAKAKAGDRLSAQISASIGGWNMYSVTHGGGGPIPTRIIYKQGIITH